MEALRRLKVEDVCKGLAGRVTTLREECPLAEMLRIAREGSQPVFPVVDDAGRLRGEVSMEDIRQSLLDDVPRGLILAHDLMRAVPEPLVPGTDLATAARLLEGHGSEGIPVVSDLEGRVVLGILTRRDLILAYGTRPGSE
jgi:CIC family chloride channel protein